MRYGVGIQNKILEAMAMATPVVTTPQTLASLQVQIGRDILVADTPRLIADAVANLLTDRELWQQLSQAGRRYVESHHSWGAAVEKLETVYRDAMIETAP